MRAVSLYLVTDEIHIVVLSNLQSRVTLGIRNTPLLLCVSGRQPSGADCRVDV